MRVGIKDQREESMGTKGTKRFVRVAAVVAALTLASFGVAYAITGGNPDVDNHYSYVGMVAFYDGDGEYLWRCSGTLVSPTVFLTAGHCTEGPSSARVFFDWNLTDLERPYTDCKGHLCVEGTPYSHPDYWWGPTSNPHDVGVVALLAPVTDRGFAELPTSGFLDDLKKDGLLRSGREGAKFRVVGYGVTVGWPPTEITAPLWRQYADSEYLKLLKAWLVLSQNQAPGRGDGGTCGGDSGGPAFWTDPDTGEDILVGITSWGDAVCAATGFYYRVDIPD